MIQVMSLPWKRKKSFPFENVAHISMKKVKTALYWHPEKKMILLILGCGSLNEKKSFWSK